MNKKNPEHQRYAQRLNGLEQRNSAASPDVDDERIGKKMPAIHRLRTRTSSMRIALLTTIFGLILLICLYLISPLSKITTVTITDNRELSTSAVYQATTVRPGRCIWSAFLGQRYLEKQARVNNPQIKTMKVAFSGPRSVKLTISENSLLGMGQLKDGRYAVLSNGHLQVTTSPLRGIQFTNFANHKKELAMLGSELGKLKPAIYHDISLITYSPTANSPHQIIMYMKDGNTVKVNLPEAGSKLKYYPSIAATMKQQGVIDLRVGAYSYPYGSKDKWFLCKVLAKGLFEWWITVLKFTVD